MLQLLLRRLVLLSALAALAGCASRLQKLETPLSEAAKADHVVIMLAQSEIAVDDADMQNIGGGLIGVLLEVGMESTMTRNRQRAITPLRDMLIDYRYEDRLVEAIQAHLPTALVKSDASFKLLRNDEELRLHVKAVAPANVFVIRTRYAMEHNLDIAYVYCAATLATYTVAAPGPKVWRRMSAKQQKHYAPTVLHQGTYYAQHMLLSPFGGQTKVKGMTPYQRNAALWSKNNAEPLRAAFAESLQEMALLIQRDGARSLPPIPAKTDRVAYLAHVDLLPMDLKVKRIEQVGDRSLVARDQSLNWIDDVQLWR